MDYLLCLMCLLKSFQLILQIIPSLCDEIMVRLQELDLNPELEHFSILPSQKKFLKKKKKMVIEKTEKVCTLM